MTISQQSWNLSIWALQFNGVDCSGCIKSIEQKIEAIEGTDLINVSEITGNSVIKSNLTIQDVEYTFKQFEGCCSNCQIKLAGVSEYHGEEIDQNKIDRYSLIKRQYKKALDDVLSNKIVACSEHCVCKLTDINRVEEFSEAPSFASIYDLHEYLTVYLQEGMSVVDFGSGTGHDAIRLIQNIDDLHITGIDVTPEMVSFANNRAKMLELSTLSFIEGSDLSAISSHSQNLIYTNNVFNMLDNRENFVQETFSKLELGGYFVISDEFAIDELPEGLRDDPGFQCGGIAGAETLEVIEALCTNAGFNKHEYKMIKEYEIEYKTKKYRLFSGIIILKKD